MVSPKNIIPSAREMTGDNNNRVVALDKLTYFNPQYQVNTYKNNKPPEIVM